MIEHRLIERMLTVVGHALKLAEQTGSINPLFVDMAVDFFITYADRTHHGKEEDILFKTLKSESLSLQLIDKSGTNSYATASEDSRYQPFAIYPKDAGPRAFILSKHNHQVRSETFAQLVC